MSTSNSSELANPAQNINNHPKVQSSQAEILRLLQLMTKSPSKLTRMRACFKITKLAYKRPKEILRTCSLSQGPIFCLGSVFLVNKNDEDYRRVPSPNSGERRDYNEYAHIKAERFNQKLKRRAIMQLNKHHNKQDRRNLFNFDSNVQSPSKVLFYYSEIDKDNLNLTQVNSFTMSHLKACKIDKNKIQTIFPDPKDFLIWFPIHQLIELNRSHRKYKLTREYQNQNSPTRANSFRIQSVKLKKEKKKLQKLFPKKIKIHCKADRGRSASTRKSPLDAEDSTQSSGIWIKRNFGFTHQDPFLLQTQNRKKFRKRSCGRWSNRNRMSVKVSRETAKFDQLGPSKKRGIFWSKSYTRATSLPKDYDSERGGIQDEKEYQNLQQIAKKKFLFSCVLGGNPAENLTKIEPLNQKRRSRSSKPKRKNIHYQKIQMNKKPIQNLKLRKLVNSVNQLPESVKKTRKRKRKMTNVFDIFSLSDKKKTIVEVMRRLEMRNQAMMEIKSSANIEGLSKIQD